MVALYYIACNDINEPEFESYFDIPENEKCFFDLIIRNALVLKDGKPTITDLGFMYQEKLVDNTINFKPVLKKIETLDNFFGHKELNANNDSVLTADLSELTVGYENDFVLVNNEKYSLLFIKS